MEVGTSLHKRNAQLPKPCGTTVRETWMEGSFSGDSERYVKAGSENRDLSIGGPLGDHKGKPLSRDFERKLKFCLLRRPCSLGTVDDM
jgi:hypothetical protein